MAVIDFPVPRDPAAEAKAETLVAALDATFAIRCDDIESAQQNMVKAWDALQAWADVTNPT